MWNPINRTTVQVEENKYRIYPKQGPLFYKNKDGGFGEIDLTFNDTSSSIGEISLMDKGVMSVGKRKGNNPHKVVGIRPDKNQHLGTQQLEFSLVNVELDGESQSFNVETDLEVQLGLASVFQLVKVNKDFTDFKVEFDIHNTGLELLNKNYSENTTIRNFNVSVTNLGEIEGGNTSLTKENVYNNSSGSILSNNSPHLDIYVSQITNEYIQKTEEYSIEEEFGDSDLSNYTLETMYKLGSSIYFKDCIILNVKSYQIEDVETIMKNNLCDLYGLEILDDGIGKYFIKNNKKVGAFLTTSNSDEFYVMFNTKTIPNDIKTLFKRKTFDDTSFLDITLSDFHTAITNRFTKDTTIELDTSYYEPINDRFLFKIKNESFHINPPTLFDENYNILDLETTHSLKQNDDGSYRYTKYFSMNGYLKNTHNIKYIDADVTVSAQDAYQRKTTSLLGVVTRTSANHTAARNATTGINSGMATNITYEVAGYRTSSSSGNAGTTFTYTVYNSHILPFDTSGISDTITSAHIKPTGGKSITSGHGHSTNINIIYLKTNSPFTDSDANDYNDLVGHTDGWDADDVTEYSGAHEVTNTSSSPAVQSIEGTSDLRDDIKNLDQVQMTAYEYDEWYLNSFNPDGVTQNGSSTKSWRTYRPSDANTSRRAFLEYETGDAPSGYGHKVVGVAAASISKIKGIATANVGKVNTVD